jgi:hypothetical protein
MRRDYISPEFSKRNVYGTYNMIEESNFFGAKMLDIEDMISISNLDTIWYQRSNGEQLDLTTETTLESNIYSSSLDKLNNHTLIIDKTQSKNQLEGNTRWILTVDLREILSNYIFATLKNNRTFEGVKNELTKENDVDIAIENYIKSNILNRYKYKSVELLVRYKDLRGQNLLRYKNNWNSNLTTNDILRKIQTETAFDGSSVKIAFNQEKTSNQFSFEYFFNLNFEKI